MKIYHFHNRGQRAEQEDSYYISLDRKFFVVCDGVGGSNNGSVASEAVVKKLANKYECSSGKLSKSDLYDLIIKAHNSLRKKAIKDSSLVGMGTTLALLYIDEGTATIAHAGDSRVYYKAKSKDSFWVTKDHSVVQELYDAGVIKTMAEMYEHPMRNRITNALLAEDTPESPRITFSHIESVEKSSYFMLCSDGALENYTSQSLIEHFNNSHISFQSKWQIFREHCELNSKDNNTCILVQL